MWQINSVKILEWHTIKYDTNIASRLPTQKGIYVFLVKPDNGSGLELLFPMYVGKAVGGIRTRFRTYIREKNNIKKGRHRIIYLLNVFKDHLIYAYSILENETDAEIYEIEQKMMAAFATPCNQTRKAESKKETPTW